MPLNRFVDAARPESEMVRDLSESIARLESDPAGHRPELDAIRIAFTEWSENKTLLNPLLQSSFLLSEVAPVSENLSKTGAIGLRALQFLESGERPSADWVAQESQELNQLEQPQAEVVLAAVRPVRALLEDVSKAVTRSDQPGLGARDK